jgi:hypothetical protein
MRIGWIAALTLVLAVASGCTPGRGHPVRGSEPRIPPDAWPAPRPELPEPAVRPTGDAAYRLLIAGLEGLDERLRDVRARASTGAVPTIERLTGAERSVLRRYRDVAGANVRQVAVIATAGRVPLAPADAAALFLDPEVERLVLAAQRFERVGTTFAFDGHRRDVFRVEKLQVGVGPFRYDLRFSTAVESLDLGDGRIAVRYDPVAWDATTGVSLYRGLLLIEPDATGSRVTEVVVFGTPLTAPAPFDKLLKNLVYDTFRHRSTNLWRRAHGT